MQKSIQLFKEFNLDRPNSRQALFLASCKHYQAENVLYMIACWDYIYRPADHKIAGLVDVFIQDDKSGSNFGQGSLNAAASGMINVRSSNRKNAMMLLGNPTALLRKRHTRSILGFLKSNTPSKAKWVNAKFISEGGVTEGGAGNYNLMTKAIELTLPECMAQAKQDLKATMLAGTSSLKPSKLGTGIVKRMLDHWGAGVVVDMGLRY